MKICPAILLLFLLAATPARAQEVTIDASVGTVGIGEEFDFSLHLIHPPGVLAALVLPRDSTLDDLEIRSVFGPRLESQGARVRARFLVRAATFALDTARVRRFTVALIDGTDTTFVHSSPFFVPVTSLVPQDSTAELRDVKPPETFRSDTWIPFLVVLAIVSGIAGFLFFRALKRRKATQIATPVVSAPDPCLTALQELERLQARLDQTSARQTYVTLTDVVRTYLSVRFEVPALETTSSELLSVLRVRRSGFPQDQIPVLKEILGIADAVKFADAAPANEASREVLSRTRDLVYAAEAAWQQTQHRLVAEVPG